MNEEELIHELRNSKEWPTLGNAAADRIEELKAIVTIYVNMTEHIYAVQIPSIKMFCAEFETNFRRWANGDRSSCYMSVCGYRFLVPDAYDADYNLIQTPQVLPLEQWFDTLHKEQQQ